jgi:hypothetical protein
MTKNRLEDALSEEEDPSGARGMARANLKLKREGYPSAIKSIKEIINLPLKDIGASPDVDSRVREYLAQLKNAGYEVGKDYNKLYKTDLWNHFMFVLTKNNYFEKNSPF